MKSRRIRNSVCSVVALLIVLMIAFYPQRGELPDSEAAIAHGKEELEAAVYQRCDKNGVVEYLNHDVGSYPSDPPYMKSYSVNYAISVDGNIGRARMEIWGRTNWARILFLAGRTKPIADITGWEVDCGGRW